ncbi:hypothetical protein P6166_02485 [Stenotrophomonas sp. HITSZ_GD]|uniref:hypothetical protein n=1 Tax=Stenotrophomonas sp. HITSZ_GD TaxID=3037248 RepID=UPI00240DE9CA|nr:hypothetical protein [Stenotrophomonas sp. HITSZ_GD]MDG2524225.1 hypothetical protein [Stenotrophomonas sp. HITSZ_GD]
MHFAGAPEGYDSSGSRDGRTATPKPGYTPGHVMADRSGTRLTAADVDAIKSNETTRNTTLGAFKGVYQVNGRIDSKRLDKEFKGK